VNSLKWHLLSNEHKNNTPSEELKDCEKLRSLFEEENQDFEDSDKDYTDKNSKDFLYLIFFLMSQRLSFAQIETIGKFLQKSYKEKRLEFLSNCSNCSFDQRLLFKIAQDCFKTAIEEDLKEKLFIYPFTLIIDNSTLCGTNICGLKMKYLEKEW